MNIEQVSSWRVFSVVLLHKDNSSSMRRRNRASKQSYCHLHERCHVLLPHFSEAQANSSTKEVWLCRGTPYRLKSSRLVSLAHLFNTRLLPDSELCGLWDLSEPWEKSWGRVYTPSSAAQNNSLLKLHRNLSPKQAAANAGALEAVSTPISFHDTPLTSFFFMKPWNPDWCWVLNQPAKSGNWWSGDQW